MVTKFRQSIFILLFMLLLATSVAAEELQPLSSTSQAAPDLSADLFLLPAKPAKQEVLLPFSSKAGTLSIGAYNLGKEGDAPFENAGVSLAGSTATDHFNLNGSVDLSRNSTSLSLAVQPKDKPATVGLLYLYDQADKAKSHTGTPLMILPRIGNSLLLPGQSGGEMALVGMYGDYALGKDVGINWAMGYAAVNDEKADLEGKARNFIPFIKRLA